MEVYSCPCCGATASRQSASMLLAMPIWTQSQLRILETLKGQQTVRHERLIDVLWGDDVDGGPLNARRTLDVHLTNIRKKLRKHDLPWHMINTWGGGVKLKEGFPNAAFRGSEKIWSTHAQKYIEARNGN
jgi:DNA-binding winged helix-turn-helix (wHTH) protein